MSRRLSQRSAERIGAASSRPRSGGLSVARPREIESPVEGQRAYLLGECAVLQSIGFERLHLSISHHQRYPTWDEIAAARYHFLPPQTDVVQVLPPDAEYVNVHDNVFHLYTAEAVRRGGPFALRTTEDRVLGR